MVLITTVIKLGENCADATAGPAAEREAERCPRRSSAPDRGAAGIYSPARRVKEDFQLDGYTIAAGETLAPCIWLTHRRPEVYPDPYAFKPERFLDKPPETYTWLPVRRRHPPLRRRGLRPARDDGGHEDHRREGRAGARRAGA